MNESNFWQSENSNSVSKQLANLKDTLAHVTMLKDKITNNMQMLLMLKESFDSELKEIIEKDYQIIFKEIETLELTTLLNEEYDSLNCILEIHPGAGGTESQDWADMLKRMYLRWCEKRGFKFEIIDETAGEEAGIKSFTMIVNGQNSYGYLKNEAGVHRLIRISPFDSGGRRHTSFAAVQVTPLFEEKVQITVEEKDLKIDVYRSSGCGGQGVNTTDSAVRITHLPTKIVVTCQNERSQIQNKERALEVLKNKLYQLELQKRSDKLNDTKKDQMGIDFGSQIRTYTMCPYTLVKDHRTGTEKSNVDKVLDGEIDDFINDNLKVKKWYLKEKKK